MAVLLLLLLCTLLYVTLFPAAFSCFNVSGKCMYFYYVAKLSYKPHFCNDFHCKVIKNMLYC